jgi:hypothetical protein
VKPRPKHGVIPAKASAIVLPAKASAIVIPAKASLIVIPAKAGIQSGEGKTGPRLSPGQALAFAGVTMDGQRGEVFSPG